VDEIGDRLEMMPQLDAPPQNLDAAARESSRVFKLKDSLLLSSTPKKRLRVDIA